MNLIMEALAVMSLQVSVALVELLMLQQRNIVAGILLITAMAIQLIAVIGQLQDRPSAQHAPAIVFYRRLRLTMEL